MKKRYPRKLYIADLDDLFETFRSKHRSFSPEAYQSYLSDYIFSHSKRPLVLVGVNGDMGHSDRLYDLNATHLYFLDVPVRENARRQFLRDYRSNINDFFLNASNWFPEPVKVSKKDSPEDIIFSEWEKDETFHTKRLGEVFREMSPSRLEGQIKKTRQRYRHLKYKFATKEEIMRELPSVLGLSSSRKRRRSN